MKTILVLLSLSFSLAAWSTPTDATLSSTFTPHRLPAIPIRLRHNTNYRPAVVAMHQRHGDEFKPTQGLVAKPDCPPGKLCRIIYEVDPTIDPSSRTYGKLDEKRRSLNVRSLFTQHQTEWQKRKEIFEKWWADPSKPEIFGEAVEWACHLSNKEFNELTIADAKQHGILPPPPVNIHWTDAKLRATTSDTEQQDDQPELIPPFIPSPPVALWERFLIWYKNLQKTFFKDTRPEVARAGEGNETLEPDEERKIRGEDAEKKNEDNPLEEEKTGREAYQRKAARDALLNYFLFCYMQIEYTQSEVARADENTLHAEEERNMRTEDVEKKNEDNPLEEEKKGREDNDDGKE